MHTPASRLHSRRLLVAFLSLGAPFAACAQTIWDFGAAPDRNWSSFVNWSTDLSPAGTAVVFGAAGTTANATTISNVVDQSYTISALTFNHTTNWHLTEIEAGATLTVAGAFLLGGHVGGSAIQTRVAFSGAGSLVINDSSSSFNVGNTNVSNGTGGLPVSVLDLSNLADFTATVGSFNYGAGTNGTGTVYLANNSTITAASLTGGGTGTYTAWANAVSNRLVLGTSTTLHVDTIAFATGRTQGSVSFRAAGSGAANTSAAISPTLVIRGQSGGNSRAALSIGNNTEGGILNTNTNARESTADFTDGSIDALVSTLIVGRSQRGLNGTGSYTGTMRMGQGTVDATTVIIGEQAGNTGDGASTATLTGHLEITDGAFTAGSMQLANSLGNVNNKVFGILDVSGNAEVRVTGDVTLGKRHSSSSTNEIGATVNIDGGRFTIEGNLTEGTNANAAAEITSIVNLSAGVLDLTRGAVAVDNFNFTGGSLRNVGSFTGDLNVRNNASLGFDDIDTTFTGTTLVGGLTLGAEADLSISLAEGFTPGDSLLLIVNDGSESIAGTFFSVNGETLNGGNTFTLVNNTGTYLATLLYDAGDGNDLGLSLSLHNIPEPSAAALLAGALTLGCGFARRRR